MEGKQQFEFVVVKENGKECRVKIKGQDEEKCRKHVQENMRGFKSFKEASFDDKVKAIMKSGKSRESAEKIAGAMVRDKGECGQVKEDDSKISKAWARFAKDLLKQEYPKGLSKVNVNEFGDLMVKVVNKEGGADSILWKEKTPQGTEDRTWVRTWLYTKKIPEYKDMPKSLDGHHVKAILKQFKSVKESKCNLKEIGSNDDLNQSLKRADSLYKKDMGARQLISWVTNNYTDRVIFQFVEKYQDKLMKRAKEEVKLTKDTIDGMLKTLKKYPDLQKKNAGEESTQLEADDTDVKVKGISKTLKMLGFDAASKDVTPENMDQYAQWIVNELKKRVVLIDPVTRKKTVNTKAKAIADKMIKIIKHDLKFNVKEACKVQEVSFTSGQKEALKIVYKVLKKKGGFALHRWGIGTEYFPTEQAAKKAKEYNKKQSGIDGGMILKLGDPIFRQAGIVKESKQEDHSKHINEMKEILKGKEK